MSTVWQWLCGWYTAVPSVKLLYSHASREGGGSTGGRGSGIYNCVCVCHKKVTYLKSYVVVEPEAVQWFNTTPSHSHRPA